MDCLRNEGVIIVNQPLHFATTTHRISLERLVITMFPSRYLLCLCEVSFNFSSLSTSRRPSFLGTA